MTNPGGAKQRRHQLYAAAYSPAGMLTLLETLKALSKGQPEPPSKAHPTLSERIAQIESLANASDQKQVPLSIP